MKIVVLSRNPNLYSTKRLVEAGEKRGHETIVVDHLKCMLLLEKGKAKIFYKNEEIEGVDAVIPRIGASVTFYGAAVVRQFEMMKIFTATESQALVRSRDKLRSLQLLARAGVGMPKTAFASSAKNIDLILEQVGGLPVVIKLLEGTQGIGVVLAETYNSAKSMFEAFLDLDANILVQEFVKEANGADLRVFVVDGEVVGAMRRQGKSDEFRSNLHRGGTAQLVKLSSEEKRTALKCVKKLGLSVAGVDMLQSKRGPLVLEVNSSPGLEGIEGATHVDIAGKIIEYVERSVIIKKAENQ
jgi:ribosomal protein S6--L-glutamate ligase